jgi:hypothetical protein
MVKTVGKNQDDGWQEGEYVDRWSFVHLLVGIIWGFIDLLLDLPFLLSLALLIVVAVLWEYFELKVGIAEKKKNSAIDVLAAILGFVGIYFIAIIFEFERSLDVTLLIAAFAALLIASSAFGWRAYFRRRAK